MNTIIQNQSQFKAVPPCKQLFSHLLILIHIKCFVFYVKAMITNCLDVKRLEICQCQSVYKLLETSVYAVTVLALIIGPVSVS